MSQDNEPGKVPVAIRAALARVKRHFAGIKGLYDGGDPSKQNGHRLVLSGDAPRISLRTARSREEQKIGGWYLVDNNVVRKGFNRAELENYLCEGGFLKEHEYLAA